MRCVAVAVRAPLSCRLGLCVPSLQGGSKVVSGDGEGVLGIYTWGLWGDTTDRLAPIGNGAARRVACWLHACLLIIPPGQIGPTWWVMVVDYPDVFVAAWVIFLCCSSCQKRLCVVVEIKAEINPQDFFPSLQSCETKARSTLGGRYLFTCTAHLCIVKDNLISGV